jgi:hypothetical protein
MSRALPATDVRRGHPRVLRAEATAHRGSRLVPSKQKTRSTLWYNDSAVTESA